MNKTVSREVRPISWPLWQFNANNNSKQLLKYEPSGWLEIFHTPVVYLIYTASYSYISILLHSLSLYTIFSTKLSTIISRTYAMVYVYAPVHILAVFSANVFLPFCIWCRLALDLKIIVWASISLHYSQLLLDSYVLEPIHVIYSLRKAILFKVSVFCPVYLQ